MSRASVAALTLAFILSGCSPSVVAVQHADRGDRSGLGSGPGGSKGGTMVGAPGPVAGIGLPILAVAGGLIWIKSRKRRPGRLGR
ncbi:hypothetical protein ABIB57_000482 [Devosia sp. UYZn731]